MTPERPFPGSFAAPTRDPQAAAEEAWQMLSGFIQAAQMIPQKQRAADGSLPLTVIGGFLGAGKTTLVNRLLSDTHGIRIAVLVNDFGRINIDAALIRSRTEDTISLANGCACCTIAGDLTKTLLELAARDEPPEAIVLEASGLADPVGIAQVALANPALRLDGILAVIDAESATRLAADPDCAATFISQASAADLVILSKADLADRESLAKARELVGALSPGKPVIEAIGGDVPVDIVLGIRTTRVVPRGLVPDSGHAAGFETWSARSDVPLDVAHLHALLEGLPPSVLRAKGILWLSGTPPHRTVYQRAGLRSSFVAGDWDSETPGSSLVVIGPKGTLDATALTLAFEACKIA